MPSAPARSLNAASFVLLGLGLSAAALAFLTSFPAEDAWLAAGYFLFPAILTLLSFVVIWFRGIKAHRPLPALRDTCVLAAVLIFATILGHQMRYRELTSTMQRIEALAAAITEHHWIHGALPASIAELDASLPKPDRPLYKISYKPGLNGQFTLFFQPSWYRHAYSSATHSWVVSD
ncbi:MAG: hypothetical protein J0L73_13345 [Verrucomicrobia bacterium]|nr:hypothetical protein [Verrucomicrobiota bacterium]